jgi:endonuclease/exonuclease/phosphatase family metal-dependent hydrolase
MISRKRIIFVALSVVFIASSAFAQTKLRIANWNVSDYNAGERVSDFRTSIFGVNSANGLSMNPDIFIGQEFMNAAAVTGFVNDVLNQGNVNGDWAAAPFLAGPTTANSSGESAFFYKKSKFDFLGTTTVNSSAGADPLAPRNTYRYDVQVKNTTEKIGMYSVHMKSGSAGADQARRQVESDNIRNNAQGINTNGAGSALPSGFHYLVAGDFNIQSSSQTAFQTLVSNSYESSTAGKFFDPINSPGTWNNNAGFKYIHTQDPRATPGGMDDRLDMILLSESLKSGALTYDGNPSLAYSTSTWNDPNHSYRVWGNDGQQALNGDMTRTGNQMVGTTIANAIYNTVPTAGGHLPVFLDLLLSTSAVVPEPGALALIALGALGGLAAWRRR